MVSWNFLAVKIPDSVTNSIMLEFTEPDENNACAAANVAWPQSSTCQKGNSMYLLLTTSDQEFTTTYHKHLN